MCALCQWNTLLLSGENVFSMYSNLSKSLVPISYISKSLLCDFSTMLRLYICLIFFISLFLNFNCELALLLLSQPPFYFFVWLDCDIFVTSLSSCLIMQFFKVGSQQSLCSIQVMAFEQELGCSTQHTLKFREM